MARYRNSARVVRCSGEGRYSYASGESLEKRWIAISHSRARLWANWSLVIILGSYARQRRLRGMRLLVALILAAVAAAQPAETRTEIASLQKRARGLQALMQSPARLVEESISIANAYD